MLNIMPMPVRRLLRLLGVDRAVGYSLLFQGCTLLIQPITVIFITEFLSETEFDYFGVFGSLVAVQMYCELGLGMVTLQFFSHEAAHLHWTAAGILDGPPAAKARLASMLRLSLCWYGAIAATIVAVLLPVGWELFVRTGKPGIAWQLPWVWTVLATGASLLVIPFVNLQSGCGKVADSVRMTGTQGLASSVIQWAGLAAGGALLAWPTGQTAGLLLIVGWFAVRWWPAITDLMRFPMAGLPRVRWWTEVWPFQWRVAVGAPFGYLTSQIFAPVLFATPAFSGSAGRMWLSLAVMNTLFSATHAWVGVRMPRFGALIAHRNWTELDRTFRQVFLQSTLLAAAGAVAGWAILVALQIGGYKLGTRMLPPLPLALLMANVVIQHMVHALSSYLRAHKQDPFFWLFICFGVAMGIAVFTVGRTAGPTGMAASLVVLNGTICLAGGAVVFARCRRAWHVDLTQPSAQPAPVG